MEKSICNVPGWEIADIGSKLEIFGNRLKKIDPQYEGLNWIDAVDLYIVQKYKWFPKDVRAMHIADKAFVLTKELNEMKEKP